MAAKANGILPYAVVPTGQVILFPAVVIIESVILWRVIRGSFLRALWLTLCANAASTAAGAALFAVTMSTIGNPLYDFWSKYHRAAVFTISLSFAVVLLAGSIFIERFVIHKMQPSTPGDAVSLGVLRGNCVTYLLIWLLSLLAT